MVTMKVLVLLVLFVVRQTSGSSTAAPTEGPSISPEPVADKSPHLLYMQRLHDKLKDTKQLPDVEKNSAGSLLATSIEADNVVGPGNPAEGLDMAERNQYILQFSIPRQKDTSTIHNAELWLFPRQQVQKHGIFQMTLVVVVKLAHAKQPRKEIMTATWNTEMDCIVLNMTSLSKKVSKNLKKKELEQANITVSIDIVASTPQNSLTDQGFVDMCSSLAQKSTKTPFLVVKYYTEQPQFDSSALGMHVRKRGANTLSTPPPPPSSRNCSVVPLYIDLTKVYGPFIVKPKILNVSNCYGTCNILQNSNKFSNHATVLERYKLIKGGDIGRDVSCVPAAYTSQDLLIYQANYLVIVEFSNMIVTECACR